MAADTVHLLDHPALERPKITHRDPLFEGYLEIGEKAPPASSLPLAELHPEDPELWRQQAMWDRFERLRNEAPVHYTADSFVGPFWSITRYEAQDGPASRCPKHAQGIRATDPLADPGPARLPSGW